MDYTTLERIELTPNFMSRIKIGTTIAKKFEEEKM